MEAILKQAKKLIAEDKLETVIQLLTSNTTSELVQNQLTVLSARFNAYEENKMNGLLDNNQYAEANKIRFALMNIIGELKRGQKIEVKKPVESTFSEQRQNNLKVRIEETFQLINAWQQKQSLAENPNEERRCKTEIIRLNHLVEQYIKEYNSFGS